MIGHSLGNLHNLLQYIRSISFITSFFNYFFFFTTKLFTGSHIAGRAAKQLKSQGKIANIVGLDPASVGFDFFERNKRLTDSDADYVQIIHTDGDKFGFANPLGHGTSLISYHYTQENTKKNIDLF